MPIHPRAAARYAASVAAASALRTVDIERFAILGPLGRCGSELLVTLLDSHAQIHCEGEIIGRRPTQRFTTRYLMGRAAIAGCRGAKAHGCKLLATATGFDGVPGDPKHFFAEQRERGMRFVTLRRRNLLRQALSFIRAHEVGVWHHKTRETDFESLSVDPVQVIAYLHALEWMSEWIEDALSDAVDVSLVYEDDLVGTENQQRSVDAITDTLGLDRMPVSAGTKRIAPTRVRDIVANYDEVAPLVRATRFAWMLDDS